MATARNTATLTGHSNAVNSANFSPDGKTIVSGSWDNAIKLWDVATGQNTATLTGHSGIIRSVNFSPNGKIIVSGSEDRTVKLWDVNGDRYTTSLTGNRTEFISVNSSPDGKTIVSSDDNKIKLWDVAMGRNTATFTGHSDRVSNVNFSPDGKTIMSVSVDETIKLWDVATMRNIATLTGNSDSVSSVNFSPDGKTVVLGSRDKTIKLWDVATGRITATLTGHSKAVNSVNFSPNGKTIVSVSYDKTIKFWDVATGRNTATLTGHSKAVNSVNFSPDGKTVVSESWVDGTIKLWNVATGRNTATLTRLRERVGGVNFSPDGKVIVSVIDDKTIKLWDVASGRNTATLTGHRDSVDRVNFSPDGKTIVSVSYDKTIKLWDVASGRNTATLTGLNDSGTLIGISDWVKSVNFSPDSKVILSVSYDKTIKLWGLSQLYDRTLIDERIRSAEASFGLQLDGLELRPYTPDGAARPRWPTTQGFHWLGKAQKGDAEAMYQLGMIYDRDNDIKNATSWYQRALKAGDGRAKERLAFLKKEATNKKAGNYIEQAFKHIQAKEWRQAITLCSQALQLQPENTDAFWYRGIAYDQLNEIDRAIAEFRQVIRYAPNSSGAHGSLGWLLIKDGRFKEAVWPATSAYELAPDSYAWTANYGHTFFLNGERDQAMKYYQETISKLPDEKALQEGPIADFELFIKKGWQVKASQEMIKWMKEEFRKRPVAKGER